MNDRERQPVEQVADRGFTTRLEQLRLHAGQPTLESIARKAGRSIGAVSNTFTGKAVPSNETARRIVEALGSPFDDEWRALLDDARAERGRKAATDPSAADSEGPGVPASAGGRRRTALIAGITTLVLAGVAAVGLIPEWGGSGADRAAPGGVHPVVVTRAGPLGLIVRSSAIREGDQVGSAAEGQTLWAECRAMTDFDPRPDTGTGPLWYRVRWPSADPGKDFAGSTPQDEFTAWVYGGYAVPSGPGGATIPEC